MSCNLCHAATEHKPTCPTLIPVTWSAHTGSLSAYEVLTRTLFDMWSDAEQGWISERGTPEDENRHRDLTRHIRRSLEDGDPVTALELLRHKGT